MIFLSSFSSCSSLRVAFAHSLCSLSYLFPMGRQRWDALVGSRQTCQISHLSKELYTIDGEEEDWWFEYTAQNRESDAEISMNESSWAEKSYRISTFTFFRCLIALFSLLVFFAHDERILIETQSNLRRHSLRADNLTVCQSKIAERYVSGRGGRKNSKIHKEFMKKKFSVQKKGDRNEHNNKKHIEKCLKLNKDKKSNGCEWVAFGFFLNP